MADEVLSEAELETLLGNLEAGVAPKTRESPGHAVPPPHAPRFIAPSIPARSRDGGPAGLLPDESLAAIRTLGESFARGASASLSVMLRTAAEIKPTFIEQTTYGQFTSRLQNPTCASVVRAGKLSATWLLETSPVVFYAMIDRMLGGGREASVVARRPLTDIESRLAARITRSLLAELENAWRHVVDLDLALVRVESNPRLALIGPSHEPVTIVGFAAQIDDAQGPLTLCIPSASLAALQDRLRTVARPSRNRAAGSKGSLEPALGDCQGPAVELIVHLAESMISPGDLANLRVGDVIDTETDAHSPVLVRVDGTGAFVGQLGAIDGRKAIRIDGRVGPHAGDSPAP